MKKQIYLLLALLCIAGAVHAQIITVRDEISQEALEMVVISSPQNQTSVSSNEKGRVDISAFKGLDSVQIRYIGYETQWVSYAGLSSGGGTLLLKPNSITLESTVVSASRFEQNKREVPNKITTIKSRDVMLQNPQTAADLLGTSGDVYIQKSQMGGGSPIIRGFATNRVLLTVDGVRMNSAIFRTGNVQNVINLDPMTISSTEVLYGPGSVMYGSDAIGGVMNFYTLKPMLSSTGKIVDKANVMMRYSSANTEKTGHFDFNLGFRKWSFLSSVTYSDYDDLRMGKNGPEDYLRKQYAERIGDKDTLLTNPDPLVQKPSAYNQLNLMQKIRFKPSANWDFQYAIHYSEISSYPRYDRLTRPQKTGLRSAEWMYGPQIWAMNHLSIQNTSANVIYDKLNLSFAHQYFKESRIERDFNKPTRFTRTEQVEAFSANLDLEKKISDSHTLIYGLEYITNLVESEGLDKNVVSGIQQPGPSRYPNGSDWSSYAAYLNYRWLINEKLTLQSGIRYSHYVINASFDTTFYAFPFTDVFISQGSLSGSAGLVYNPDKTWQLSLNASSGFRAPNIDDIGKVFDSSPGSVVVPNPNLRPENAYNLDAGIAKVLGGRVFVDLTGFYTYLDNGLARNNFRFNGQDSILYNGTLSQVQAIQNTSYEEVYGVQGGLEVKLPYGLSLSSRYTWMKGREYFLDGKNYPLSHGTPAYGISHIKYQYKKLILDAYAQYNSAVKNENFPIGEAGTDYLYAKDTQGKPYSPSWMTLNFKAMYHINRIFFLTAGVENFTDKRYRPYASGISAPGRNFIVALRATF